MTLQPLRRRAWFVLVPTVLVLVTGFAVVSFPRNLVLGPNSSPEPAVEAAGRGNPWMNLGDGRFLPSHEGGLEGDPLTLAIGDFDEDGFTDLVTGYATEDGGAVDVRSGNPDGQTRLADRRLGSRDPNAAPFKSTATRFELDVRPDFLAAGDFDADGHLDVVAASRETAYLEFLPGNGDGKFSEPSHKTLPGAPTALTAGDVNRQDLLEDLVVAVTNPERNRLLVFESPRGALTEAPETYALSAPASSVVIAQLDDDIATDIAVAAGREVTVIHGRDRQTYHSPDYRITSPATISRIAASRPVRAMSAGNYTGDRRYDLVLLDDDGALSLLNLSTSALVSTPYAFPLSDAPPELRRARLSSLPYDAISWSSTACDSSSTC